MTERVKVSVRANPSRADFCVGVSGEKNKRQRTNKKSFQKWKIMIRNPFVLLLMLFCLFRFVSLFFFLYKTKRNENNIPDAFQNGD
jgi:F0F1-type ATP synthase membrane subunit a